MSIPFECSKFVLLGLLLENVLKAAAFAEKTLTTSKAATERNRKERRHVPSLNVNQLSFHW